MRTLAVLPSRFSASRFPGKPLALILGRPMIQWVFEAARRAQGVDRVVVATDDERIAATVRGFGGEAVLTDPALPSGTDRTAAALATLEAQGEAFDCVLNIQGDEPAMHPDTVAALVTLMKAQLDLPMGTAACPFSSAEELFNPNHVKVVTDDAGRALILVDGRFGDLAAQPGDAAAALLQGLPGGVKPLAQRRDRAHAGDDDAAIGHGVSLSTGSDICNGTRASPGISRLRPAIHSWPAPPR